MDWLYRLRGSVYVLVNPEAQRVKIGVTINKVEDRLRDVNDMWLGRKGSCQVCATRLVLFRNRVPPHGRGCKGAYLPALETDSTLSAKRLAYMKSRLESLPGVERAAVRQKIRRLERVLASSPHSTRVVGSWSAAAAVETECAEAVERLAHSFVADRLDRTAPIGEVFACSVAEAVDAIHRARVELGLEPAESTNPNR